MVITGFGERQGRPVEIVIAGGAVKRRQFGQVALCVNAVVNDGCAFLRPQFRAVRVEGFCAGEVRFRMGRCVLGGSCVGG